MKSKRKGRCTPKITKGCFLLRGGEKSLLSHQRTLSQGIYEVPQLSTEGEVELLMHSDF